MNEIHLPKVSRLGTPSESTGTKPGKADAAAFKQSLADALQSGKPGAANDKAAASQQKISESLKFSGHALNRLRDRGISMNREKIEQLEAAVEKVAAKGARESLVLTDEAAYIVSVDNKTVITALDRGSMNGNVFTNIDSTILI